MADTLPTISIASIPGGQIAVSEAGLPNGTLAGQVRTSGAWTFTIQAPDGVGDLTVGGYQAITDGVFTAGSIAFGPGVLSVTGYDPAAGSVTVTFEITSPFASPSPGPQQRYGDFLSASVELSDQDGDEVQGNLLIQIRDDETLTLTQDSATAVAGGPAVTGNFITGGEPDRFTADGFGGVTRIGRIDGAWTATPDPAGNFVFAGQYGTLTVNRSGDYSYVARADAPSNVVEHITYWAADGDGDEASSWLHIEVQAGPSQPGGGQTITASAPGATLTGGGGADTITASQGGDSISTGGGADLLVLSATPWSPHVVEDFTLGSDRLDFQPLKAAYGGSDPVADRFIWFLDDGAGGTKVLYDQDGSAAGQPWPTYILHLKGVAADGLTWSALTSRGGEAPTSAPIVSPGPYSTLAGGAGDDTITASQAGDTLSGGAGADLFVFDKNPWSPHTVQDFHAGEDRLDISSLLQTAGYSGTDPVADSYVWLLDNGAGGLNVLFDVDGPGPSPQWPNFLVRLEGVPATTTWAELTGGQTGGGSQPSGGGGGEPPAAGGQTITSAGPGSVLTGGSGADTLTSSRGPDVLTGGDGSDRFVFPAENWAPARITDFQPGIDRIDVRGMLDAIGYAGSDPFSDGYMRLIEDGAGGTKVLFDSDAAGPAPQWANYVFQVEHVTPAELAGAAWIFQ